MDNLSNTVFETYRRDFQTLPLAKQFHFASRLAAWSHDDWAQTQLATLKPAVVPIDKAAAKARIDNFLASQPSAYDGINEYEKRLPYFTKYPWLFGLHLCLLQLRHWFYIYDYDARDTLKDRFDMYKIDDLVREMLNDTEACQVLSTYAVNTAYLWQRFINQNDTIPLFRWWRPHAKSNPTAALFDSYFITHCIIADSLFYERGLPATHLLHYQRMLDVTDAAISNQLDTLTTDAALETLVTHLLVGTQSPHKQAIIDRCRAEFDQKLGYLTDPRKPTKSNFIDSEHRNVLYLMANVQPSAALLPTAN